MKRFLSVTKATDSDSDSLIEQQVDAAPALPPRGASAATLQPASTSHTHAGRLSPRVFVSENKALIRSLQVEKESGSNRAAAAAHPTSKPPMPPMRTPHRRAHSERPKSTPPIRTPSRDHMGVDYDSDPHETLGETTATVIGRRYQVRHDLRRSHHLMCLRIA